MKGCFVGSGSEGLQQAEVCTTIVNLTKKSSEDIVVLYIGTATYDLAAPKTNQTVRFIEAGCDVKEIKCVGGDDCQRTSHEDMVRLCGVADVIIVSGGNTLFAIDTWNRVGLVPLLRDAANRGAVLTGGSAGAICWFDAGHSDSADPDTFKDAMLGAAAASAATSSAAATTAAAGSRTKFVDESSSAPTKGEQAKDWQYIRVPCLGFFPGLVCPHADKVQSNGILRVKDFDEMLLRHKGERGLCIDHFAALVVDGDEYSVLSLPGRPGSLLPDGTFSPSQGGVPAVWQKDVDEASNVIITQLVPSAGKLSELLKQPTAIIDDPRVALCRVANPSNGPDSPK